LHAVSPEAELVLMGHPPGNRPPTRLDVWSISPAEHRFGFRPYDGISGSDNQEVTWTSFVDEQHLLTSNDKNLLVLWNLAESRALWSVAALKPLVMSPGGRYLACWDEFASGIFLCEALTGKCSGVLKVERKRNAMPEAVAFAPDGASL